MPRYKITVHELGDRPVTEGFQTAIPEHEVFKMTVDQFDPVSFTRAVSAQPRRRRSRSKPDQAST